MAMVVSIILFLCMALLREMAQTPEPPDELDRGEIERNNTDDSKLDS